MHNPCMYLWVSFVTNPSLYKVLKGMPLKNKTKTTKKVVCVSLGYATNHILLLLKTHVSELYCSKETCFHMVQHFSKCVNSRQLLISSKKSFHGIPV